MAGSAVALVRCRDVNGDEHLAPEDDLIDRLSVYAVCIHAGSLLLARDTISGRWFLPGGGVETGEELDEALQREVLEETGIVIDPPDELITEWTELFHDLVTGQAWRSRRTFFRATMSGGVLLEHGNGDDTTAAAFIPLDQLAGTDIDSSIGRVLSFIEPGSTPI